MISMNNSIKAIRQSQLPLVSATGGGISQVKPTRLSAQWMTENDRLVCHWVQQ
ncbi:MAG: hypothetical protein VKJ64_20355 [Leptolyngbyaceae bacterium]|nr:hypothetical protein [Leptolyngbyaceae bacterium]